MKNRKDLVIEIFSGTPWEAEMIKSLLENVGIESFLKQNTMATYAYNPIFSEGVKVMILNSDFEKAKEIVDDYYRNMKK
jgi:hypothetical protein